MNYLQRFTKLRVDRSKGEAASHKPILLLSILQAIANKEITENKIYITPGLVARFRDNWYLLVTNDRFTPKFYLPFYHLKSEGWWHLQTNTGKEILLTSSHSIKGFAQLKESVAYAYLDEPLYGLIQQAREREILVQTLLQTYFNQTSVQLFKESRYNLAEVIEQQILFEDAATYRTQVDTADEEERYIRGGVFKKVIPHIYNYTCCISGMRIITSREVQMIDACHIVPFAESHNDTVSNGLSLCPNLHRAFDRHLIAIDPDYRVVVSPQITEDAGLYTIRDFASRTIALPKIESNRPAKENLARHYERFRQLNF